MPTDRPEHSSTIILNRAEVLRILSTCDKVDAISDAVFCPDTGVVKEVTVLKEKEAARAKTEDNRRAWMVAIFGAAGASALMSLWALIRP